MGKDELYKGWILIMTRVEERSKGGLLRWWLTAQNLIIIILSRGGVKNNVTESGLFRKYYQIVFNVYIFVPAVCP